MCIMRKAVKIIRLLSRKYNSEGGNMVGGRGREAGREIGRVMGGGREGGRDKRVD